MPQEDSSNRDIGLRAIPIGDASPPGNAGLFIGINDFDDRQLRPLRFAVNDAIALACFFVVELRLIPPKRCMVVVRGTPTPLRKSLLDELQRLGCGITDDASQGGLLDQLGWLNSLDLKASDLLVSSVATHGFTIPNAVSGMPEAWIVPSSARRRNIAATCLRLEIMQADLDGCGAGRRFALIDACREDPAPGTRDMAALSAAFESVFDGRTGQVTLLACRAGQLSNEHHALEGGLCTFNLIDTIRQGEAFNEAGEVTPRQLALVLPRRVNRHAASLGLMVQEPEFKHSNDAAMDIAIAVDGKKRPTPAGVTSEFNAAASARSPMGLGIDRICMVQSVNGKNLQLEVQQGAYGLGSGKTYSSGVSRLDPADCGGTMLFFWEAFTLLITTDFIPQVCTPENVFEIETALTFKVVEPSRLCQFIPKGGNTWPRLEMDRHAFGQIRSILKQVACERPVEAMLGVARPDVEKVIAETCSRTYSPFGLKVSEVCIRNGQRHIDRPALPLIRERIDMEAKEKGIEQEEAFKQFRREIEAPFAEGDKQCKTIVASLAGVGSFKALANKAEELTRKVEALRSSYNKRQRGEPILLGGKNQMGGRFAVLSPDHPPQYFEICRNWIFIGRDENCHVLLPSDGVSSLHMTVARVGNVLAAIDQSKNGTILDGERISQRYLRTGDVIRIDPFWLVFKLEPAQEFREIDPSLHCKIASHGKTVAHSAYGADLLNANPACDSANLQLFASSGQMATSNSAPILIGEDSACGLRLFGGEVARFHAIGYWDKQGVCVDDLHSGRGTILNGKPVKTGVPLRDHDILQVGGHRITVTLIGNIAARARRLGEARPTDHGLAITCIEGTGLGVTRPLTAEHARMAIGRDDACQMVFPTAEISSRHAEIVCVPVEMEDGTRLARFQIADLNSTNGTFVNGARLGPGEPHSLSPGDVVRLGWHERCSDLLVHWRHI